MKEPKTFLYPRIYRQEGLKDYFYSYSLGPRTRIIYPNGRVEWYSDSISKDGLFDKSCFAYSNHGMKLHTTGEDALIEMRKYDRHNQFNKAEFIGEIK